MKQLIYYARLLIFSRLLRRIRALDYRSASSCFENIILFQGSSLHACNCISRGIIVPQKTESLMLTISYMVFYVESSVVRIYIFYASCYMLPQNLSLIVAGIDFEKVFQPKPNTIIVTREVTMMQNSNLHNNFQPFTTNTLFLRCLNTRLNVYIFTISACVCLDLCNNR